MDIFSKHFSSKDYQKVVSTEIATKQPGILTLSDGFGHYDTSEDSFEINHKLENYFKESCQLASVKHFFLKYILNIAFA